MSDELLDLVNASLDRLVATIRSAASDEAEDYNQWIALLADRPTDDDENRARWMPRAVVTTTIIWDLADDDTEESPDEDDSDDTWVEPTLDEDLLTTLRSATDDTVAEVRAAIAAHPAATRSVHERVRARPTPGPDDDPDFEDVPAPTAREPHMVDSLIQILDQTGRSDATPES